MKPTAIPDSPNCGSINLNRECCQARQKRLVEQLKFLALDAALLSDRRHVHYFSGYWNPWSKTCVGLLVLAEGQTVLAAAHPNHSAICVDIQRTYQSTRYGTLVDNQEEAMLAAFARDVQGIRRIGYDRPPIQFSAPECVSLHDALLTLRRAKDEDEINLLRCGIAGCEAAYRRAQEVLRIGISEIELYVQTQAAAVMEVGEPIGDFGNDFQFGSPGGPPRARTAKAGEMIMLDLSVIVRGYNSDMCRTFAVDRSPSRVQCQAHDRVLEALAYVESHARPGVSCRELFKEVHRMLDGYHGWRFFHHLGHGIGLSAHEAPHLNPEWSDVLQIGDVFTVEPGLYGDRLQQGVRVENVYRVKLAGVEKLTNSRASLNK